MYEWYPILVVGGIVGLFSAIFIVAYMIIHDDKEGLGFERHMSDREILRGLLRYARPHWKTFLGVLVIMLLSTAADRA